MATIYFDVGDLVRADVTFTNSAGNVADPTTVSVIYTSPSGTTTTKTYITDSEVVKDSTGKYHIDITIDEAGMWYYRWEGTGTLVAAVESFIAVRRNRVPT